MRQTGILLAISSLPGRYGIGDFDSKKVFSLIRSLKKNHISHWQILPLAPIGYGHSPYQPFSSYAIDEVYIDLQDLADRKLIKLPERVKSTCKTNFEAAKILKDEYIIKAFNNFVKKEENLNTLKSFLKANKEIDEYAEFISLKEQNNNISWNEWSILKVDENRKLRHGFAQMILLEQWDKIRFFAKKQNIKIIGDVPFYVGFDSSDVYYHRNYFLLDEKFNPTVVAGVPPDFFSEDGQKWGNPIYNWDVIEKEDFMFIVKRIEAASKMYDVVRLDHFRAFDSYWAINPACPNAADGEWRFPNGYGVFNKVFERNPNIDIIAEDLGDLRPEVLVLKNHFKMPGMRILEFSIWDEMTKGKVFDTDNTVYYTGTHDNETLLGWLKTAEEDWLPKRKDQHRYLLNYALNRKEYLVILPAQDVMCLDNSCRMNCPGIIDDFNWTWKLNNYGKFNRDLLLVKEQIDNYGKN